MEASEQGRQPSTETTPSRLPNHLIAFASLAAIMNGEDDAYILLLLADSNLPTGSFVASSGLESFIKHGFGPRNSQDRTVAFVQDSLASYARSALPFVSDAHLYAMELQECDSLPEVEAKVLALDQLYESMTLNHIARRASRSQGVALLTLYSKGFSVPRSIPTDQVNKFTTLVDRYKLLIRREEVPGHLPVCWGILTAALGLTLGMSTTQARKISISKRCHRTFSVPSSFSPCQKFAFGISQTK
jgi:urease accessory protein